MKKPVSYSDISFKKKIPNSPERITFQEAFIRALDLIDFYVAISDPKDVKKDDGIVWIELTWKRKHDH